MKQLIETFYRAFAQGDAETMASCYHPDAVFEDPAFGKLSGREAGNMWRMLCESQRGKGMRIEASGIQADAQQGSARWVAHYVFSPTGRAVRNEIEASFRFRDGKIASHTDAFDLYRWSRQAMGPAGWLLGWTPFFRKKLQARTRAMLQRYEQSKGKA
jgi:ketosteroid isomerase-like protein